MTGVPRDAPRPPHTCTHHPAGSRTCHDRHGCRCRACTDATTTYRKRHEAGLTKRIPVELLRAHIAKLEAAGMTYRDMQRAGGVSETIYRDIATGRVREVLQRTARRILATSPGGQLSVPSIGAARRLRALAVNGFGLPALSPLCGLDRARLNDLRRLKSATIPVADHETVVALYDQLWNKRPPETRFTRLVRAVAARNGWSPALAWDDDTIDDPNARPAGLGPDHSFRGEAALEVAHLLGSDSAQGIARRLGKANVDSLATSIGRSSKSLDARLRAAKEVA